MMTTTEQTTGPRTTGPQDQEPNGKAHKLQVVPKVRVERLLPENAAHANRSQVYVNSERGWTVCVSLWDTRPEHVQVDMDKGNLTRHGMTLPLSVALDLHAALGAILGTEAEAGDADPDRSAYLE